MSIRPTVQRCLLFAALISFAAGSPANAQEDSPPWKVFPVFHSSAEEVSKVISKLYEAVDEKDRPGVVADSRTNVLFVTGSNEAVKNISELLKMLDKNVPRTIEFVDQIKIFSLKHETASTASQIVSEMMGPEVKIVTDERTNSLIVNGSDHDLSFVEAILMKLDQADSRVELLMIYHLQHVSAESIAKTLEDLSVEAKIAIDAKQNRLLVQGNESVHRELKDLLKSLDVAEEQPLRRRLQLRIVWLLDEKLVGENATVPSANLASTLKVLEEKLEIKNLKTAAQMFVSIDPDEGESIFDTTGTAQFAEGMQAELKITGTIKGQKSNSSVIELQISATKDDLRARTDPRAAMMRQRDEQLASLMTKVVAPDNHSIVLGVTSIQSASSVFVLQVLPAEDNSTSTEN